MQQQNQFDSKDSRFIQWGFDNNRFTPEDAALFFQMRQNFVDFTNEENQSSMIDEEAPQHFEYLTNKNSDFDVWGNALKQYLAVAMSYTKQQIGFVELMAYIHEYNNGATPEEAIKAFPPVVPSYALLKGVEEVSKMCQGLGLVCNERIEQIFRHRYDQEHDIFVNSNGELLRVASWLLYRLLDTKEYILPSLPGNWDLEIITHISGKPKNEQLSIIAAMISAELRRLIILDLEKDPPGYLTMTCENTSYENWVAEFQRMLIFKFGWRPEVAVIDTDAFRQPFEEGLTPQSAYIEDLRQAV